MGFPPVVGSENRRMRQSRHTQRPYLCETAFPDGVGVAGPG